MVVVEERDPLAASFLNLFLQLPLTPVLARALSQDLTAVAFAVFIAAGDSGHIGVPRLILPVIGSRARSLGNGMNRAPVASDRAGRVVARELAVDREVVAAAEA